MTQATNRMMYKRPYRNSSSPERMVRSDSTLEYVQLQSHSPAVDFGRIKHGCLLSPERSSKEPKEQGVEGKGKRAAES